MTLNNCPYCGKDVTRRQRRVCTAFVVDTDGDIFYADETFHHSKWFHRKCAKKAYKKIKKDFGEQLGELGRSFRGE